MTLFLLFAGFGTLAYVAVAATVAAGGPGTHVTFGLGFTIVVSLWLFDVGAILLSVARYTQMWVLLVALVLSAALAVTTAGARNDPEDVSSVKASAAVAAGGQSSRPHLVGRRLFNDLGCAECHTTGIGPELANRFGRPVADSGCGGRTVDDDYIRESILNPTAVMVAGFSPIMPSFAGRVSDSELAALVAYVASLGTSASVSQ